MADGNRIDVNSHWPPEECETAKRRWGEAARGASNLNIEHRTLNIEH